MLDLVALAFPMLSRQEGYQEEAEKNGEGIEYAQSSKV